MNNQTERPVTRAAQMHSQISVPTPSDPYMPSELRTPSSDLHMPSELAALASKRAACAIQVGTNGLRVHEWQLNVSPARVLPSIASQPSELPSRGSALDTSAKAFFHAANAFETRVATLLMYNAARVKRM